MNRKINVVQAVVVFFIGLTITSCIRDEFKFGEIQVDDAWKMDIVSPLFTANLEFKDLIHDWDSLIFQGNEPISTLDFSNDSVLLIPTRIIFEPATIIDSLFFLIDGNYELVSAEFTYIVDNGSPFPLNFQMSFFEYSNASNKGPAILPDPFLAGNLVGNNFVPTKSIQKLVLNAEQLESFKIANRMEVSTWFDWSDIANTMDTFQANYPVNITILLSGEVKGKGKDE